jgi:REP element-mobilizing transposase RayT
LAEWRDGQEKRAIYHCVSRVVDRRFVLKDEEREKFRMFMRMQENFSGCKVLAYCIMSNHFHILLEVPPKKHLVLDDEELLKRLSALYTDAFVGNVAMELKQARDEGNEAHVEEIYARFTYRMQDLSEFMKTLLQRFTRWFNRTHDRTGTLWEQRYKSVIVESGHAARTMAAYIDLNPVRAGMKQDPTEYRWSSYGEAICGNLKGNGKKARLGLMRACEFREYIETRDYNQERWTEVVKVYRQMMGMALERKAGAATEQVKVARAKRDKAEEAYYQSKQAGKSEAVLQRLREEAVREVPISNPGMLKMLRHRVRYFTDGAVIGSKEFVNEAFSASRERFSESRKDGARKMRGNGKGAGGTLWSGRDLRVGV